MATPSLFGRLRSRRGFARLGAPQLAAVDRREVVAATSEELGDYLDRWLAEHRTRIEDYTYRAYEVDVRLRLKPALGAIRLRDLTAAHVRALVTSLVASARYSNKTINNTITVLRVALAHAVEDWLIATNAAAPLGRRDRLKLPAQHREMDYLRADEIPRYLDACRPEYRPLAELLVATGMRIGEAVALEWGDIDWRGAAIVLQRARKHEQTGGTKGKRQRRVEVGPRLLSILEDVRATRTVHALDASSGALVFPAATGGYLNRSRVSRIWHHEALARAELRATIRLHDVRHSAAAAWIAAGLPLMYIQRQLGHSTIATTEQHYGHLAEGFLRDAAERAEASIWRVPLDSR